MQILLTHGKLHNVIILLLIDKTIQDNYMKKGFNIDLVHNFAN